MSNQDKINLLIDFIKAIYHNSIGKYELYDIDIIVSLCNFQRNINFTTEEYKLCFFPVEF